MQRIVDLAATYLPTSIVQELTPQPSEESSSSSTPQESTVSTSHDHEQGITTGKTGSGQDFLTNDTSMPAPASHEGQFKSISSEPQSSSTTLAIPSITEQSQTPVVAEEKSVPENVVAEGESAFSHPKEPLGNEEPSLISNNVSEEPTTNVHDTKEEINVAHESLSNAGTGGTNFGAAEAHRTSAEEFTSESGDKVKPQLDSNTFATPSFAERSEAPLSTSEFALPKSLREEEPPSVLRNSEANASTDALAPSSPKSTATPITAGNASVSIQYQDIVNPVEPQASQDSLAQTESEKEITPSEKDTLTTTTDSKQEINSPVTPFTSNITESTSNTGGLGNDHLDAKAYEALGAGVGGGIIAAGVSNVDTSRDLAASEQKENHYTTNATAADVVHHPFPQNTDDPESACRAQLNTDGKQEMKAQASNFGAEKELTSVADAGSVGRKEDVQVASPVVPSTLDREQIPVGGSAAAIGESYPASTTTAPHETSPNVSSTSSRTEKTKVPLGDKIAGSFEKIVGKLTKNEQKIEHGQAKKDGTLLL